MSARPLRLGSLADDEIIASQAAQTKETRTDNPRTIIKSEPLSMIE